MKIMKFLPLRFYVKLIFDKVWVSKSNAVTVNSRQSRYYLSHSSKSWEICKVLATLAFAFIKAGTKNADILREINFDEFIVSKTVILNHRILRENNLD